MAKQPKTRPLSKVTKAKAKPKKAAKAMAGKKGRY
jgi:hypothetical protein